MQLQVQQNGMRALRTQVRPHPSNLLASLDALAEVTI